MNEFEMIEKYFKRDSSFCPEVILGNGDDCALLQSNKVLALSIDTLVLGVHFTAEILPFDLGKRALAINLSDCAAMGAEPLAFLLSLTLPELNDQWLDAFSRGLFAEADAFKIPLIGGNTTRGPLSITIQIVGALPAGQALKRGDAQIGDDIYVSGVLGAASVNITPRIELGLALQGLAHAAIDISDGVIQDLNHILHASNCGAILFEKNIPCYSVLEKALYWGEDYELCFTAPKSAREAIAGISKRLNLPLTSIGIVTAQKEYVMETEQGVAPIIVRGYQHFL